MVSVLARLAYLIKVAVAIGAAVALVLKARAQLQSGRAQKAKGSRPDQAQAALS